MMQHEEPIQTSQSDDLDDATRGPYAEKPGCCFGLSDATQGPHVEKPGCFLGLDDVTLGPHADKLGFS